MTIPMTMTAFASISKGGPQMLLRKDLEIIFSSPEIKANLAEVERLYHRRFDSEQDKTNYTQAFTRFRAKVENIKSGNMH